MKKVTSTFISMVMIILLAATMFIGCSSSKATSGDSATGGKTLTIGMSWAHKNDTLFYAMEDTLTAAIGAAAKENGYSNVKWIHVIAGDDSVKQASDIEDLITKKVDVIISYTYDSKAIESSIKAAHKAGIPFISWDRNVDASVTEKPDLFVGLDTTTQAYSCGIALFKAMKDAGTKPTDVISIIGDLADQNALNRIKGFKKAADEYGVTITQEVPSEWNSDKALSGFSAAYQAHPNTNCVLIASDFIITSVQSVLEANKAWIPNGQKGHVWIGSQDVFPVGLEYLRNGYMDYDTAYDLNSMSKEVSKAIFQIVDGKYSGKKEITVGGTVVSKSNVDTLDLWAKKYEKK